MSQNLGLLERGAGGFQPLLQQLFFFLGDNFASVACTFFQASCRSYGFGKVLISEAYKLNARSSSGFYLPEEARRISGRGLPSWPKARDLRSRLAGVRGFESRTPHHCYRISSFQTFLCKRPISAIQAALMVITLRSDSYDIYIKIGLKYGQCLLVLVSKRSEVQ